MTIKTLLTASILMLMPLAAQAQCFHSFGTEEAAISCAEGTTYDADTRACVATASS